MNDGYQAAEPGTMCLLAFNQNENSSNVSFTVLHQSRGRGAVVLVGVSELYISASPGSDFHILISSLYLQWNNK